MPREDFFKLSREQILEAIANDDAAVLEELCSLIKDCLAQGFALQKAGKGLQTPGRKAASPIEQLALSMATAALAAGNKKE